MQWREVIDNSDYKTNLSGKSQGSLMSPTLTSEIDEFHSGHQSHIRIRGHPMGSKRVNTI